MIGQLLSLSSVWLLQACSHSSLEALRHGSHSFRPTCKYTNACLYLVSVHQMSTPQTEVVELQPTTHLCTPKRWKAESDTYEIYVDHDIDVDHYFFKCPKYETIRRVPLQSAINPVRRRTLSQSSKLDCFSVVALAVRRYIGEWTFRDTCGYIPFIYTSVSTSALSHTVLFLLLIWK